MYIETRNLGRTFSNFARAIQIDTNVFRGIGSLGDFDTRQSEISTRCWGRTVDADNRVAVVRCRTKFKSKYKVDTKKSSLSYPVISEMTTSLIDKEVLSLFVQ